MATFVTLFVATEDDLDRIFPGWPLPPDKPTLVRLEDPDTGEQRTEKRWIPRAELSGAFSPPQLGAETTRLAPVLAPESDYEQHMEERAPRVLCAFPHACLKHLFGNHIEALASILLERPIDARPARVTPEGFPIDRVPQEAVAALSKLATSALPELAEQWASGPAAGFEGPSDALWVLRRLHALALLCTSDVPRSLCLWIEA